MAYVKQTWVDRPSKTTPINAARLNHMEEGIYEASQSSQSSAMQNAGSHNVFRGKDLGTSFTDAQSAQIVAGTFDDLFVGDYWTLNNVVYRIAGFDIYLGLGSTKMENHHVVIVPDTNLYNASINSSDSTSSGYLNSTMKQTNLLQALETIKLAFGENHILSRSAYLVSAATDGVPSEFTWQNSQIDIMNENQLFGKRMISKVGFNEGMRGEVDYAQFPLFQICPNFVCNRSTYWIRDMFSGEYYIAIWQNGMVTYTNNTMRLGVRPFFLIA